MPAASSVFPTTKLFVPLDVEVEISLRHTRSDDVESCLEIPVDHRPHLETFKEFLYIYRILEVFLVSTVLVLHLWADHILQNKFTSCGVLSYGIIHRVGSYIIG